MHGRLVVGKNNVGVNLKGTRQRQPSFRSLHIHHYISSPSITLHLFNAELFMVNYLISWTILLDPHVSAHQKNQAIKISHQPVTLSRPDWTGLPCPDGMVAACAVIEHLGTCGSKHDGGPRELTSINELMLDQFKYGRGCEIW